MSKAKIKQKKFDAPFDAVFDCGEGRRFVGRFYPGAQEQFDAVKLKERLEKEATATKAAADAKAAAIAARPWTDAKLGVMVPSADMPRVDSNAKDLVKDQPAAREKLSIELSSLPTSHFINRIYAPDRIISATTSNGLAEIKPADRERLALLPKMNPIHARALTRDWLILSFVPGINQVDNQFRRLSYLNEIVEGALRLVVFNPVTAGIQGWIDTRAWPLETVRDLLRKGVELGCDNLAGSSKFMARVPNGTCGNPAGNCFVALRDCGLIRSREQFDQIGGSYKNFVLWFQMDAKPVNPTEQPAPVAAE